MRLRRIVTLPLASRLRKDCGLFLSLTIRLTSDGVHLRSPLRPSQSRLSQNRRVVSAECCGRCGWPTLCFVSGIGGRRQEDSVSARLRMRPLPWTLQTIVAAERQFSRTFPAHPRSLASVLFPRPAARRVSASAAPPFGFRLSKNLCATSAKRFFEPSEKDATWPWERGTLASLRARVSRG